MNAADPSNPELGPSPNGERPFLSPDVEASPPRVPLRIAIGFLLVLGMAAGWWAMNEQRARKQLEAVQALNQAGCHVYFEYQWSKGQPIENAQPPEARWLRAVLGEAAFRRAVAVDARENRDVEAVLDNLRFLPYLQYLDLSGVHLPRSAPLRLRNLAGLRALNLADTGITDNDVALISTARQLTQLSLAGTEVSDRCARHLAALHQLKNLDLANTHVSRDAIKTLQRQLPNCKIAFSEAGTDDP